MIVSTHWLNIISEIDRIEIIVTCRMTGLCQEQPREKKNVLAEFLLMEAGRTGSGVDGRNDLITYFQNFRHRIIGADGKVEDLVEEMFANLT